MFLSSRDEVPNKMAGFEAGATDYLTKPFEVLEVKARARSLLKAKAYATPAKETMASELRDRPGDPDGPPPLGPPTHPPAPGSTSTPSWSPPEVGGDLYSIFPPE